MSWLARLISRRIWAGMLWFMRRRWMKRLQRGSVRVFPAGPARDRAWNNFRRQERFARKYGLHILTFVVTLCLYSIGLMLVFTLMVSGIDQGWLPIRPPDPVQS